MRFPAASNSRTGGAGAQQFAAIIPGEFQIHQLAPNQAVGRAPARVIVVGIEGVDFGNGPGLSAAVDAAVPVAVQRAIALIKEVHPCA